MPINPETAWALHQRGNIVSVKCAECGELMWTNQGQYMHGKGEWECGDCVNDLVEETIDEMVEGP